MRAVENNYLTAIPYQTQRLANRRQFLFSMNNFIRYILLPIFFLTSISIATAERPNPVASRNVGGNVLYYFTLHEAFGASVGTSIYTPDEITLLADITLNAPLIIGDNQHIILIPNGSRTIIRGSDLIDYPVIWVSGENASLTLGNPQTEDLDIGFALIIDGGYLQGIPIIANAPLAAVNGPDSKLIMNDNVFLQNNCNEGASPTNSTYEIGAGVFIRTAGDIQDRLAEFIMRGGVIQGNFANLQTYMACGGGVMLAGFSLFTM